MHDYRDGAAVFYVSVADKAGKMMEVTDEEKQEWRAVWDAENDKFNSFLETISELVEYTNKMFFVCDGNHRRQAWMSHISRLHNDDSSWHIAVDSILLDTKDRIRVLMQAMHDINK